MASNWNPPVELSVAEQAVVKRCAKRPLFVFLRNYRHLLFDDATQELLLSAYSSVERGKERVPPAQLAMAMLMQAAFDVPDHEAPELTVVDMRWQMVLGCNGSTAPLFSQGTVYNFRMRCIAHGLIQHLIDRIVRLAYETKGFSGAKLRAALDSSPLWGAGRVEDTFNLIGRTAAMLVRSAARRLNKTEAEVAQTAGIPLVTASSIKAGLDLDWNDKSARTEGLRTLLGQVDALKTWLGTELKEATKEPPLCQQLEMLDKLIAQDTEPDPDGGGRRIKKGVAPDRQISVHDPEMRHGRKSASKRFDGYKRHILVDLTVRALVRAVAVTPGNKQDAEAAETLLKQAEAQGAEVVELHGDLAYTYADAVHRRRARGMKLVAKAHPVGNGTLYDKTRFRMDFAAKTVTCPGKVSLPMQPGELVHFPAAKCGACAQRSACTSAKAGTGRTLNIHKHESLQVELRAAQATPEGRAAKRERTQVEHGLARIGQSQGVRARYRGVEKNAFDLGRHAIVSNCHVLAALWREAA
jgi:hypothetical protein